MCPEPIAYPAFDGLQSECDRSVSGNSVKIVSISPDTSKPLYVGQTVTVEVEVEYKVGKTPATITLNIQKGEMTGTGFDSVIASKEEVVFEKAKSIILRHQFKIPETRSIQIFTPLQMEGQTSTSTVDTRSYKVINK